MAGNTNCLNDLLAIPEVLGAFLAHSGGHLIASRMPQHFAQGHVEKSLIEREPTDSSITETVGGLQRHDFQYYEFRVFVYTFAKGALYVLCRPKVIVPQLDNAVLQQEGDIVDLLKKGTGAGRARTGDSAREKQKESGGNQFFLPVIACLILLIIAGGAFLYLKASPSNPPVVQSAPPTVPPAVQSEPLKAEAVNVTSAAKPVVTASAAEVLLRIEGSATLGEKLTPQIASGFMKDEMFAGDVRVVNGKASHTKQVVGTLGDGKLVAIEIISKTSNDGFACLETENCDIAMSSRPVNPEETARLQQIGPMTNSASEHILALDGIAVVLHPVNRIDNLSLQQIADIFTGKITSWSQLPESGLDGDVQVYGRGPESGSNAVFRYLALRDEAFTSGMKTVASDAALADQVAADKFAIGFVSLPYMKNAKAIAIEQDGAAPVFPTPFTVSTEDYPLSRRLYFYTAVNPKNYLARPFFQYALGDGGQNVAQNQGFVSLTIDKISSTVPSYAPQNYRDSINDADRLSLNFRFRSGSSELDNRGKRDLERLIAFLIRPENRGKSIRLLGFADSRGERAANCYLSKVRAEKVATILQWRGITTEAVEGFCDDMPIATNATALGRERNRRVEVWLGT